MKIQAKTIHAKLTKTGVNQNWKNIHVASCGKISKGLETIDTIDKSIVAVIKAIAYVGDGKAAEVGNLDDNMNINFIRDRVRQYNSTIVSNVTMNQVLEDPKTLISALGNFNNILGRATAIIKLADLATKQCDKFSKAYDSDPDENLKAPLDVLRKAEEVANMASKTYVSVVKSILYLGKALAKSGKEKPNSGGGGAVTSNSFAEVDQDYDGSISGKNHLISDVPMPAVQAVVENIVMGPVAVALHSHLYKKE